MKKIVILVFMLVLMFTLCSCKDKEKATDNKDDVKQEELDKNADDKSDSEYDLESEEDNDDEEFNVQISDGDYSDFRNAITLMIRDFKALKTPFMQKLTKNSRYDTYSSDLVLLYELDMFLEETLLYDTIDSKNDGTKVTKETEYGQTSTKELKEDMIEFYSTFIDEYSKSYDDGYLDINNKLLTEVNEIEFSDGSKVKTVYELRRYEDNSFVLQYFVYSVTDNVLYTNACICVGADSMTVAISNERVDMPELVYDSLLDKPQGTAMDLMELKPSLSVTVTKDSINFDK